MPEKTKGTEKESLLELLGKMTYEAEKIKARIKSIDDSVGTVACIACDESCAACSGCVYSA